MKNFDAPSPDLPLFKEEDVAEFIESREIKPEDLEIIESLSKFSKILFHEFHNFFNLLKDRSVEDLKKQLDNEDNDERREFLEHLLRFAEKYHWTTC